MAHKHILALAVALLSACPSLAQEPDFAPGQVWTYEDSDTADSRVTILAVEDDRDLGRIVLVRMDGLDVPSGQIGSEGIPVLGLSRAGLERSVLEHVDTIDVSDAHPDITQWRDASGMVAIGTVGQAVARVKKAFALTNELLELRKLTDALPAYLPKDDSEPKAFPEEEAIRLLIIRNEVDNEIHWELDGTPYHEAGELLKALEKRAAERIPDPDHPDSRMPRPVLVLPGPKVTYGDVAEALDLLNSAGLDNVHFGDGKKK